MLRLALDENFPAELIPIIRDRGHEVLSALESMPAAPDESILVRAQKEKRIVVTLDKDFGDLAYGWGLDAPCGVILFRLHRRSRAATFSRILEVLDDPMDWNGHFASVSFTDIRLRPLPDVGNEE